MPGGSDAPRNGPGEYAANSGDPSRPWRRRQTYGPARLQAELRADGFPVGVGRIKRLRKKLGIRCQQVRRFTLTTDSAHRLPVADNRLAQTVTATRLNETWVTDITYIATAEGWWYLAEIKDLYTCEVVGHAMGDGGPHDDGLGE